MFEGSVLAIYLRPTAEGPMKPVESVAAVAGRGLEGDHYFDAAEDARAPGREVTLIEQEAIDGAAAEYGLELEPGESRRNVVTTGVPLNHLVGREFTVGDVVLRGTKLCEPCGFLQSHTGKPVMKALLHRGGLRATIVRDGVIDVGAPVRAAG